MNAIVLRGDARALPLPDASVDLVVTSPPYFGLRSYTDAGEHYAGQIGSEATPVEYVAALVECTAEWVRVLKPSGSLWVNLGDKYAGGGGQWDKDERPDPGRRRAVSGKIASGGNCYGLKPKSLLGLPWRYALACIDHLGLILRAEVIWSKPNGLPESVTDRVRRSHEQWFHFTRQPRYYSAVDEIREAHAYPADKRFERNTPRAIGTPGNAYTINSPLNPLGKLPGSVWTVPSQPLTVPPPLGVDHFAAFPMELPRRIIAGWSPPGVCTSCGEGRRPVWERPDGNAPDEVRRLYDRKAAFHQTYKGLGGQAHQDWLNAHPKERVGYTCGCLTDLPGPANSASRNGGAVRAGELLPRTTPAIVLDPFGGTGTTALIASTLGRTGISIDRSLDYCRLAAWRTTDPAQRAAALQVPKPPAQIDDQLELFGT